MLESCFHGLLVTSWLVFSHTFGYALADGNQRVEPDIGVRELDSSGLSESYNNTANLTAKVPFNFDENPFTYTGTIDTSQTIARRQYSDVGEIIEATWQQMTRFYPATDETEIPAGTNAVFYLDEWQVRFKWGVSISPPPAPSWTRGSMDVAGKNLKRYFRNGEGKPNNRHAVSLRTQYLAQSSQMFLEVSETRPTAFQLPKGPNTIYGSVYTRDRLPPNVCSALFDQAIEWATSSGAKKRIPDGTWRTWVANDVSLRLYVGSLSGKPSAPAKYRELIKVFQAYRSHITRSGQPGWAGALIFFAGPTGRYAAGSFELAPGLLPSIELGNGTQQAATVFS